VVPIDMKISPGFDRQIHKRVTRERLEHVIEKSYARLHLTVPPAVQKNADVKIRLFGGSGNFAYSWHRISRMAAMTASISSSLPMDTLRQSVSSADPERSRTRIP
jgi:hypothetical protein